MQSSPWWRIGWRNLGRNRRRTLITALGLACGYFAVVFMVGWAGGLEVEMIENGTRLLTGQIQIHASDYRPERRIYDTIGGDAGVAVERLLSDVEADPSVTAASPRVYAGGLVSSGESTSAGILMGVDPARERSVTHLMNALTEGRDPSPGAHEVLIGSEMAKQLGAKTGDEVVLVAPAADGSMGNDLYTISGIFESGMAELDATYALLPMDALQSLVALEPGRIHEVAIMTDNAWTADDVAIRLAGRLAGSAPGIEVEPWMQLRPEMLDYARLMESWYFIIIVIVFAIAVFGVANTMLMSTFERRREFAVMLALGTTPVRITYIVLLEAVALGLLSLIVGAVITFPLMIWWHTAPPDLGWLYGDFTMFGALIRPVLRVEYDFPMAGWAALALLVTAVLAALYPAARAARLPPADTLSGL